MNGSASSSAAHRTGPDGPSLAAAHAPRDFRPDIEGLRGVAILLVVAYHAGVPGLQGGYVGVDVFFVLSGYLITGLLVAEVERTGRVDLAAFYSRRVRRLLPAAALMLAVTLALGAVLLAPLEARPLAVTGVATALYASNLWFAVQATDYLSDGGAGNPLLHTWSLAVEEQFYLLWPLLVVWAMRRGGRTGGRRPLVAVVAGVSAVSLAGSVWLTGVVQPWAFFASPTRAWEFGFGALAWLAGRHGLAPRPRGSAAAAWLGMGALVCAAALLGPRTLFPGWAALLPVLATVALLSSCGGAQGGVVGRALRARPLQWFGRLSYSWYLWHWPALVFAGVLWGEMGLPGRLGVVVFALGVAAATYALFENPIRFHPVLVRRPAASFALGGFTTVGGLLLAMEFQDAVRRSAAQPEQAVFARARDDRMAVFEAGRCRGPGTVQAGVRACVFGDTASATTLVLFGDSHAAHWLPALRRVARERRLKLVAITKPGCPAARVTVYSRTLRREFTECDAWRDQAVRTIAELRPAAVVVASTHTYVGESESGGPGVEPGVWRAGVRQTVATLAASGTQVLVMRDNPRAGFDVPLCLSRAAWRNRDPVAECSFPRSTPLRRQVAALEQEAVAGVRHASFVDLTPAICTGSTCPPMRGGIVVFRDASHLTRAFSEYLAPSLYGAVAEATLPVSARRWRKQGPPAPQRAPAPGRSKEQPS
ncbi:acyltransferase family protein [Longimicrobium sp.]|uniref:acyltransferase family protein n=1 Tax=Longimicrobium sp. TaxID=2029185 RepID=UPI003B3A775C